MTAPLAPALAVVRCPTCTAHLDHVDDTVVCPDGHRFSLVAGRAPDLAGATVQTDSLGQRAMRFQPLVDVYESTWRPVFTSVAGGVDPDRETATLFEWLDVDADAVLVDLACGPGNTTRRLAVGVPDGTVVGIDLSVPMLTEAVTRTPDTSTIGFVRADAHHLPVDDDTIDGVHCAAAIYLLDDPGAVIAEVARVLRPGGRFAGMTLVSPIRPIGPLGRFTQRVGRSISGLSYPGADELAELCTAAGLTGFRSERTGASLLFVAEVAPGV